jgi:RNA polymerase sigma factor (sigma-70 family)
MQQAELDMLVLMAQQNDERALFLLFEHYQPSLLQFAFRLTRDQQLAQDAVQNMWVKILLSLRRLENPAVFKSWIFRSLKWAANDLLRQRQTNQQRSSDISVEELEQHSTPVTSENDALNTALLQLPVEEYQAVYLFYFEQLTIVDIALVQEVPIGTVKTRLYRGKAKMKLTLETEK